MPINKVTKFKRKARRKSGEDEDEIDEDTRLDMVAIFVHPDTGGLITPPPEPPRLDQGPSTARDLYLSGGHVRCMFIRPGVSYMCLGPEFWGRLYGEVDEGYLENTHIDGWSYLLLWWRYRAFTRPTQLRRPLKWTIMPIGFAGMIKEFVHYKDEKIRRKNKKTRGVIDDVEDKGESGVDYKYLMGFADGTRAPYPPWWTCDKVLFPLNIPGRQHWILVVFDLLLFDCYGYDSLPNLCEPDERNKLVEEIGRYIIHYMDAIGFWKRWVHKKPFDHCQLRLHMKKDAPVQTSGLGDCGVWVCRNMETIANDEDYAISGDTTSVAMDYRMRMVETFFRARFDWQAPDPR